MLTVLHLSFNMFYLSVRCSFPYCLIHLPSCLNQEVICLNSVSTRKQLLQRIRTFRSWTFLTGLIFLWWRLYQILYLFISIYFIIIILLYDGEFWHYVLRSYNSSLRQFSPNLLKTCLTLSSLSTAVSSY